MLQDNIKEYLSNYVEHLVYVEDVRVWADLSDQIKQDIFEKVITKYCKDYRFHAFIMLEDFLLCSLQQGYDASTDLYERMLDLVHCPVSSLIRHFVDQMQSEREDDSDISLEKALFDRDIIAHMNEALNVRA